MKKDYQAIFNERLNVALIPVKFNQGYAEELRQYLEKALMHISFFSMSIAAKEHLELIGISKFNLLDMNMQQAFNVLNMLKTVTPTQLGIGLDEYGNLVETIEAATAKWNEIAEPHITAVRAEVTAEAEEDAKTAQAEAKAAQVRANISAGGHKGLAKQVKLS